MPSVPGGFQSAFGVHARGLCLQGGFPHCGLSHATTVGRSHPLQMPQAPSTAAFVAIICGLPCEGCMCWQRCDVANKFSTMWCAGPASISSPTATPHRTFQSPRPWQCRILALASILQVHVVVRPAFLSADSTQILATAACGELLRTEYCLGLVPHFHVLSGTAT